MGKRIDNKNELESNDQLGSLGFIFPRNEKELDEFEKLYSGFNHTIKNFQVCPDIKTIETVVKKPIKIIGKVKDVSFFKRAVLAAEIASKLHGENTFGHVKFQKLLYLCEQASNLPIDSHYSKQAAGPFDRIFMHVIDKEFEKQKWFQVKQETTKIGKRYIYEPLDRSDAYKQYYNRYFSDFNERIQQIIEIFKKSKTDEVEVIATIYACWVELLSKKESITIERINELFYNWSVEKKRFTEDKVAKAFEWMKENELYPKSR